MRDPILHTAEGLVSGAIGTKVLLMQMAQTAKLPEDLKPTEPSDHPGKVIARKLNEKLSLNMSEEQIERTAGRLQWAYGLGWGALLGIVSSRLRLRSPLRALLAGVGLGTVVWAVGYTAWLPALGLTPPVRAQRVGRAGTSILNHIGYGLATALPLLALRRLEERFA